MTWFKVDDTAHSHPKLIKATNAAVGLWMRCGAYAAQHLTEGVVPGVVAQLYGTAPQARKLVAAGLWHEHGHACPHPKCRQPAPGDFYMHDFLIYNPTRARVEDERSKAAERQARGRARQAEKRSDSTTNAPRFDDESTAKESERSSNRDAFWDGSAGQERASHRDGTDPSRWSRPDPTRSTSYGGTPPVVPQERPGPAGPAEQLLARWWETYGRTTAQSRTTIGRAIADALANGLDSDTLWSALDRLGSLSKPITGGTLQFALSELRRPAPGADVIPLDAARPGRVARAAGLFAAAAGITPQEGAQ
ncbi:mucin-2 [Streptomyces sp. NPDC055815]